MSSYYPSFNYMGFNSLKDKNLVVVHFENGDTGDVETFLSMESIQTETIYGSRKIDYGAKYNSVAVPKISVMKLHGQDFSVDEVRDFLKWTTGARQVSYLDLLDNEEIKCSFLGRVINVLQHKLDSRTIGFTIEFESISPWAYSQIQTVGTYFGQTLYVDSDGVLIPKDSVLKTNQNGVLYNTIFSMDEDSVAYIDNSVLVSIDNKTDDLYTFVNLNMVFTNGNSDHISIKNVTTGEETVIKNMKTNEVIELTQEQFISSSVPNKIFGNDFNFVWPRLVPGINQLVVSGTGKGHVEFSYRYPIKIGDMAINTDVKMC